MTASGDVSAEAAAGPAVAIIDPGAGAGTAAGGRWEARTLRAFAQALALTSAVDLLVAGSDSLAAAAAAAALGVARGQWAVHERACCRRICGQCPHRCHAKPSDTGC